MTIRQQTQVTVLMCGGLDSVSCAHFLLKRGLRVHGLFIDHGQPAARPEARASTALCPRFQVKVFQMSQRSLNTVQKSSKGRCSSALMTFTIAKLQGLLILPICYS